MIHLQTPSPTKVMFYCHDTYGLGHLRRTLMLSKWLRDHSRDMSQLIVTGSPVAHVFPLPGGADYVKLPSVVKTGADQYVGRTLATPIDDIRDMRGEMLVSAARHFQPDVLIVDHAPAGLKGEAVPALCYLKEHSPRTRLIVGLRDVADEPSRVRRAWSKDGTYHLLDDVYDAILVYGHPEIYDVAAEYGLSPRAAAKTRYVGYLRREPGARSREEVRAELPMKTDRLVVVTAGGGGDGAALFRAALTAMSDQPRAIPFDCLIVGGPLISVAEREELQDLAGPAGGVHFLDFTDDMASFLGAADAVIAMGGYNTVCEILSAGVPSLIVPRVHPRQEQLIRAEALAGRDLLRMLHPDALSPERLMVGVQGLLANPPVPPEPLPMDGLAGVTAAIDELLATEPPAEIETARSAHLAHVAD